MKRSETIILTTPESQSTAERIASIIGVSCLQANEDTFTDGEVRNRLETEAIKDKNVIVVGSTYGGPGGGYARHTNLTTLMWGARNYQARSVSAVIPMMGYSTMERDKGGEIAKGRKNAEEIASYTTNGGKVFFVGLHSEDIYSDIQEGLCHNIKPYKLLASLAKKELLERGIVI